MRCPDCNKFVSYDDPECEVDSVEIDENTVRASVTVNLNCADCSGTLKSATIESETEFEHTCKPVGERDADWKPDPDFSADDMEAGDQFELEDDGEPEGDSRMETKDRNGKPIKSARYMKTFYGFTLSSSVKCRCCGEVFSVETKGEEMASAFEEQV